MPEIGQSHILRVAAVWGTTVLDVKLLGRGQSYLLGEPDVMRDHTRARPDGSSVSAEPFRTVAGGWEVDARGVVAGLIRLRGRDEDPVAMQSAPIPIVPGDYGLLQYGLYSLFFQYTTPAQAVPSRFDTDMLVALAVLSSAVMHFGGLGMMRALSTPPPLGKPLELSNAEEVAERFGLHRAMIEPPPPPEPAQASTSAGGGGIKDPGVKDTKPQGGGKKMAGAEGKAGLKGTADHNEIPGDPKPTTTYGGLSDVLNSDTGQEIKQTLKSIATVSDALGGLNSNNVVLGSGPGTGLKGAGSGGGGNGPGVMYGSGTLDVGMGYGRGGGGGTGGGGLGAAGKGGSGTGGGSGSGDGTGTGGGKGPGEKGVAGNAPGGGAKSNLSPEQIRRVVMAHYGALRACFEIELQKNPNLKGGVTVAWTIDASGGVTSANVVNSSIGNPRVDGCVLRQIRTWHFPASEGTTNTSWPFVMSGK